MGFLSKLAGGSAPALINQTKAGNLNASTVMATQPGQITPDQPGSWKQLAVPIPNGARQFSATEAQAIAMSSAEAKVKQEFTKQAYKSIREMSTAFTEANVDHEATRRTVARHTLKSTEAKALSAATLHEQRPAYAKAQRMVELFHARAEGAIKALA